ncbi:hypothetical protein BCR43DRAFT_565323 [Syncephalastrum racemosum]|uniref:Uncharacterized protein n=1 Tax=Syncephalastrum racemosum TaxID=13706 RepID=A0A1X2H5S7_SYNRA|nr:hypothetical protein BCR43DRAFT_565323 [Syncephalastrum racemosum]
MVLLKSFLLAALSLGSLVHAQEQPDGSVYRSDIVYPTEDTVWHVGEHVNVTFRDIKRSPDETVTLFFADARGDTLAGGPLSKNVFNFVVPSDAVSRGDGKSLLLAVHRNHFYLSTVDAVNVRILP